MPKGVATLCLDSTINDDSSTSSGSSSSESSSDSSIGGLIWEEEDDKYDRLYFPLIIHLTSKRRIQSRRFTNAYCGEPGSLHDARVLRRSPLYYAANNNQKLLFPMNTHIIGDSAYPVSPWLVKPYRDNRLLTPNQRQFNRLISTTRVVVERAFGCLKGRFRRIKFFTEYTDLQFIVKVVMSTCVLHNYCINENDTPVDNDEEDDDSDDDSDFEDELDENVDGINHREQLLENLLDETQ